MRPNQHNNNKQRSRGRGRRHPGSGGGGGGGGGGGNPANRVYESNGPDIKVRGTAQTVADKYMQLGRDAHSAGDNVMAESFYQHAEHYLRIVAAAQAYQQQMQPQFRPEQGDGDDDDGDDMSEDGGDDEAPQAASAERRDYPAPRPPEPADQPDVMGFDQPGGGAAYQPQPQRQEREFRPRNDGRTNFRPRHDRPPRDQVGDQQPRFEPRPRPPEPVAMEAAAPAQPRLEDAAPAANGNPFGDSEQPSFLRRGPATARPRAERKPRREQPEAEAAQAPEPAQELPPQE